MPVEIYWMQKKTNKAPKVPERNPGKPREFWKKLKPQSRGDEDQGEDFVLSPKRKTRVLFDAHSIPDKLTILDENGDLVVEIEPTGGKKTFEIPKGVKKIKVQVEANKDNDSKFKYKVQQWHKERKTIRWEWNGILPRRKVSTVNLN